MNGTLAGTGPLGYLAHNSTGDIGRGYDDFAVSQWILAASHPLPDSWLGRAVLSTEVAIRQVYGLPNPITMRYGSAGFGMAPSTATPACAGPPATCTLDGFVTPSTWGWRLKLQSSYHPSLTGWEVRPSLLLAYDVKGYSEDGQFSQGRHTALFGLALIPQADYQIQLRYLRTGGGDYNLLSDRSTLTFAASMRF